jgi:hypothetical protein
MLVRLEEQGDGVVVHGGKVSNRRIAAETQKRAMECLRQSEWYDFGPTFASEQLAKRHDIQVSKVTVRGWMIEGGLWKSHSRKLKAAHPWRPRRSCYGELTQWDTSDHDWLEGRGEPVQHLVRLIDDATPVAAHGSEGPVFPATGRTLELWDVRGGHARRIYLSSV